MDRKEQKIRGRYAMHGVVFNGERELELMQFPDPTPDAHPMLTTSSSK
jgi:hypothetical protein